MKQNSYRDCFFLPNELFQLGLDYGELAVYSFLKQCENRRTHYCWPQHPHHRCGGGHEYLTQQEYIPKNPMAAAPMMRFTIADPSWHFSKEQHEVARSHILSFPQGDGEGATARRTGILLYGMNNYKI